ncbi:MAG TPA: hypothetical protein VH092_34130 [Urbifossiella sp.]|jgi:hypothetical protein|nr:hypothetical protein [Urbifossiella sp.]
MRRLLLAACCLAAAARPAAALPTADEVKANVRRAVGFDAFRKLDHGLALEGKAEFFGLPGTFSMRLHPDGRYARVITAVGTHAVGFDGTTRWGRNFANPVLDLHFEEADRDRFLFGVLCHRWLAADGGFTSRVDEQTSRAYQLDLVLAHPDAGVTARLTVDPTTWRPAALTVPGMHRPRMFDFADYRTVAGVAVPARVGQDRYEGGQWVEVERGGPAAAGGPDPFARPAVRAPVAFDPAVPARVESRPGPGRMVLVRAAVNGTRLPWYVLDTGNGALTTTTVRAADGLGLPVAGGTILFGVAGGVRTRFRTGGQFTIGPATVPDAVLIESPDAPIRSMSAAAGVEIGGFVGQDFLFRAVVEVDPAAGTAAVHDPAAYRLPAGGGWEPIRFNGRAPCVRAAFDGKHAGWYCFDTGCEPPLVFHVPAVVRGKMLDGRETELGAVTGVGGDESVREGAGGEFRVLGRTARIPRVLYATDPAGGHLDPYTLGTFGPSALGPGTVVLDYPNSRIGFIPKP